MENTNNTNNNNNNTNVGTVCDCCAVAITNGDVSSCVFFYRHTQDHHPEGIASHVPLNAVVDLDSASFLWSGIDRPHNAAACDGCGRSYGIGELVWQYSTPTTTKENDVHH